MPRGWEGNRMSGFALAMRQGLKWFIHLRAQRPEKGDEHRAYASDGPRSCLPLHLLLKCYILTFIFTTTTTTTKYIYYYYYYYYYYHHHHHHYYYKNRSKCWPIMQSQTWRRFFNSLTAVSIMLCFGLIQTLPVASWIHKHSLTSYSRHTSARQSNLVIDWLLRATD